MPVTTQALCTLPFDQRGSFESGMFGWHGAFDAARTVQIAAAKRVIYDALQRIAQRCREFAALFEAARS